MSDNIGSRWKNAAILVVGIAMGSVGTLGAVKWATNSGDGVKVSYDPKYGNFNVQSKDCNGSARADTTLTIKGSRVVVNQRPTLCP